MLGFLDSVECLFEICGDKLKVRLVSTVVCFFLVMFNCGGVGIM